MVLTIILLSILSVALIVMLCVLTKSLGEEAECSNDLASIVKVLKKRTTSLIEYNQELATTVQQLQDAAIEDLIAMAELNHRNEVVWAQYLEMSDRQLETQRQLDEQVTALNEADNAYLALQVKYEDAAELLSAADDNLYYAERKVEDLEDQLELKCPIEDLDALAGV